MMRGVEDDEDSGGGGGGGGLLGLLYGCICHKNYVKSCSRAEGVGVSTSEIT